MESFPDFFRQATGHAPYGYQVLLAERGLPSLIEAPTASGKTAAAVLPWLYRRLLSDGPTRTSTARRLFLVFPTRVLTSQAGAEIASWLRNLGLDGDVQVHVMMGGSLDSGRAQEWRMCPEQPSVVIGTMDMVLSRALMRGYGTPRASYPIDFALVTNGAHIVVDEVQLSPQGTTSLRQIAAFQREQGTAEPSGLTVMSATVDTRVLSTIDSPFDPTDVVRHDSAPSSYSNPDAQEALGRRLNAKRLLRSLDSVKPSDLAEAVLDRHVPGTLTVAVVNTVDVARDVYRAIKRTAADVDLLLLHSRFRGAERRDQVTRLHDLAETGGIVVSTQCIEAGVDIDARTLVTELAPWSAMTQRIGRCNRNGLQAGAECSVWWASPLAKSGPYGDSELDAARVVLQRLEGEFVDSDVLSRESRAIPDPDLQLRILRRRDFAQLFDTNPDLSGSDIDIRPFIHSDPDLDVQLAWVDETRATMRDRQSVYPPERERCPVSLSAARKFVSRNGVHAWVFRPGQDAWVDARSALLRPQDVVLVAADSGGYDSELGFQLNAADVVAVPPDLEDSELMVREADGVSRDQGARAFDDQWLSLQTHSRDVRDQTTRLIEVIDPPGIDADLRHAAVIAGYLHDLGKAHDFWQSSLLSGCTDTAPTGGPFAKSPGRGSLRFRDDHGDRRFGFRHEVVSALMLSAQAGDAVLDALEVAPEQRFLTTYLVGSHHGHLRVSGRDPRSDGRVGRFFFGCLDGDHTPAIELDGHHWPGGLMDLGLFRSGGTASWADHVERVLADLGSFRLAYLEMLVRMADWRASANMSLAAEGSLS